MKKKEYKKFKFTVGIPYEENLIRTQKTYVQEVFPSLEKNREAYKKHVKKGKEQILTSKQKAHPNDYSL